MVKPVGPIDRSNQTSLDFGDAESRQERESKPREPGKAAVVEISDEAKDKARSKAAENAEYADKRVKSSPLIRQTELEKMKEILDKPKAQPTEQARMKFGNPVAEAYFKSQGSGTKGGGSGVGNGADIKMLQNPKAMKAGGKVRSTSSKRADGIAQKGHTKGKYL
jgi:hypothetical protein